jgi:hypothetical protein
MKTFLAFLAAFKKAWKAGDALDDDLNGNGVPEYLDLKHELENLRPVLADLIERGKRIFGLSMALANHVIEAM